MPRQVSNATQRLARHVERLLACTGERDMYPILRDMLTDRSLDVRLTARHIVVDTNLAGQQAAPDLAIYSDVGGRVIREPDHLYAVIEAKPRGTGVSRKEQVLADKSAYLQAGTRWFFVVDQRGVARLDLDQDPSESIAWHEASWADLHDLGAFQSMFGPISISELRLEHQLMAFEEGRLRFAHRDVARFGRRAFIATVRRVAQQLTEAVEAVVADRLTPSAVAARGMVEEMGERWGVPQYDWATRRGHPIEFARAATGGRIAELSAEEARDYAQAHASFAAEIAPHLSAHRLETEVLPIYAAKSGLERVLFGSTDKKSRRAITTFAYETASLILSRMLMVRFSEDHNFLTRQISNGGISAFAGYARHFHLPYQALLAQAYRSARQLYRDLFDPQGLDWILDESDDGLSRALRQSMFLLSRWNFRTVRGDILSGVYDHYLESEKRRELGEVFTRPEIARYVLAACEWDRTKTLLDPACGTGTFLVEALRDEIDRLRDAGALDATSALELLSRLNGLDINPFSVSLSQIQILWHLMDLFDGVPAEEVKQTARRLLREIRVDGGLSSLDTMGVPMISGGQGGLELGTGQQHVARRRMHDYPARYRQINGGSYDLVVGNPPYVRAHRRTREALSEDYAPVASGQFDLYVPFVFRALKTWLKPGGRMGFIVPMALLDAGYARGLRAVLTDYRLIEIVDLELLRKKTFHGVKRPTVILIVENAAPEEDEQVKVTSVPMEAYDPTTDVIEMSAATSRFVPRSELLQTRWLPDAFLADPELCNLAEVATGESSEMSTKIQHSDVSVLDKLAAAPRLAEQIQIVWVNRRDETDFRLEIRTNERPFYEARLLFQYGLKLGGRRAVTDQGSDWVYKALNIFPGGLVGEPIGAWNRGSEQEIRIYKYERLLVRERLFACREISQVPTVAPVPSGAVFQNTANLMQLTTDLPANIWVVSRIIQFYCAKVLRASVVEDITAHWYKKQFCLIPVPATVTPELISALSAAGRALFVADRRIADEYREVDAIAGRGGKQLRALIAEADSLADGVDLREVSVEPVVIDAARIAGEFIETSSSTVRLRIPNADLRRWVGHLLDRRIDEGAGEIARGEILDMVIPDAMSEAIAELDRLASTSPEEAFEEALSTLDNVVGSALGLDTNEIAYVQQQMRDDPYLKLVSPVWEKRGLSAQGYSPREDDEELAAA